MLITMNTKVDSFQNSIRSAASVLTPPSQADLSSFKSSISQSQMFIDQAKNDTQEIKTLADSFKNKALSSLPLESQDFHNHNVKVLTAVIDYFTTLQDSLQTMITSSDSFFTKLEQKTATAQDLSRFQKDISDSIQTGSVADAKFISDLQSLIGEEQTLTLSFWQNNTLLSQGGNIEAMIADYDQTLDQLLTDSKIPLINK